MYPSPGGYFTPGKMPGGYEYKANELGHLELWKGDVKVAVQSPDCSWFRDNIGTGVGSLHLGGNESGGVAHSLSSAGQNIGFKNEFSRATDDDKLFFYPAWQAVTCDGNERIPPFYTRYTSEKTANYPVGVDSYSGAVPYDFPVTITSNAEVYDVYIRLGEVYTGTVKNSIISNVTGVEIFATDVQISGTEGQTINDQGCICPGSVQLAHRLPGIRRVRERERRRQFAMTDRNSCLAQFADNPAVV